MSLPFGNLSAAPVMDDVLTVRIFVAVVVTGDGAPPLSHSGTDGFFVLLHLSYCLHTPVELDAPLRGLNGLQK